MNFQKKLKAQYLVTKMNALRIIKTYPDFPNGKKPDDIETAFYRWVLEKVTIDDFSELELSMPIYRNRKDIIVAVKIIEDMSEFWNNLNPLASKLFKTKIIGNCYVVFENIKSDKESFDLWCDIVKADLKKLGCSDKSFTY
jgi:hypothetical protein